MTDLTKLVKSFGLGITHALLDELGYIDLKTFKYVENLSIP